MDHKSHSTHNGHFVDEFFQAITCSGTDKQKEHKTQKTNYSIPIYNKHRNENKYTNHNSLNLHQEIGVTRGLHNDHEGYTKETNIIHLTYTIHMSSATC